MAYELKDEKGELIKRDDQVVLASDLFNTVKTVDIGKRTLIITGTDETRDRDGDIIEVRGWDFQNFLKNPVFLWAHDYRSVPIGAATKLIKRKDPPRVEFHERFPTLGLHPFADMILSLYNEKIINASSVGFIARKWEKIDDDEDSRSFFGSRRFTEQELLELSGCPVPCNPNAIQNALKGKKFGKFKIADMVNSFYGKVILPKPEKEDDIMEEISKELEIIDETEPEIHQVPKNYNLSVEVSDETKTVVEDPVFGELVIEESEWMKEEEVEKPYPNEHACRLKQPNYDRYARKNCYRKVDDKCVDYIFGIKSGKSELQAMRFKKDVWTAAAARKVCSGAGGSFEAAGNAAINEILDFMDSQEEKFKNVLDAVRDLEKRLKEISERMVTVEPKAIDKSGSYAPMEILKESFTQPNQGAPAINDKDRQLEALIVEIKKLVGILKQK